MGQTPINLPFRVATNVGLGVSASALKSPHETIEGLSSDELRACASSFACFNCVTGSADVSRCVVVKRNRLP